jgi:hypothetical protein
MGDLSLYLYSKISQMLGHERSCAKLTVAQLRMLMYIAPQLDHFAFDICCPAIHFSPKGFNGGLLCGCSTSDQKEQTRANKSLGNLVSSHTSNASLYTAALSFQQRS